MKNSLYDRLILKIKNNKLAALLGLLFFVIVGVSTLIESILKISSAISTETEKLSLSAYTEPYVSKNSVLYDANYQFAIGDYVPKNILVRSIVCLDKDCTKHRKNDIKLYKGEAQQCWIDINNNELKNIDEYLKCTEKYRLKGNKFSPKNCDYKSTGKYDRHACFEDKLVIRFLDLRSKYGYVNYFVAEGDSYSIKYEKLTDLNCEYTICNSNYSAPIYLNWGKLGVAPIVNVTQSGAASQYSPTVNSPYITEAKICSDLILDESVPMIGVPDGYSDYRTSVEVTFRVLVEGGLQFTTQTKNLNILAAKCETIKFEWVPNYGLQGKKVEFEIISRNTDSINENYKDEKIVIEKTIGGI